MLLNKNILDSIGKELNTTFQEISKKYGVEIRGMGGSFTGVEAVLKFKVTVPVDKIVEPDKTVTQQDVQYGMAPAGTRVMVSNDKFIITKARNKKYEAKMIGGKTGNDNYLIRFEACKLIKD